MRRSKMIDLMHKRLGPVDISLPTCEEVLDIIEQAGMLPPDSKGLLNRWDVSLPEWDIEIDEIN